MARLILLRHVDGKREEYLFITGDDESDEERLVHEYAPAPGFSLVDVLRIEGDVSVWPTETPLKPER